MRFPAKVKRCAESLQAPSQSPSVTAPPEGDRSLYGDCQSLSLWERWQCEALTERASPSPESRHAAISCLFGRAMLSLRLLFFVSVLALSVTFGDSSPKGGASGVPVRPTRDEQSLIFSETVVLRCQDSRQLDKVRLSRTLPSVARPALLRHIGAQASSRKWPGLPRALPLGELASGARLRGQARLPRAAMQR